MSVAIRLQKVGKRGTRIYRIVAVEKKQKRDSQPIEILGTYTPKDTLTINEKRLSHWQSNGARVSPAVRDALAKR